MRLISFPPVSRPSFQVSNCDDDNLVLRMTVDNLIRKPLHQHAACSAIARKRAYFLLCLNEGCRLNDGINEFSTQPRPLPFVPLDGCGKLVACFFEISDCPRHRRRMSFAIRRFALSHDSNVAVPASIERTRRWISFSQAESASGSAGPSRLASNSAASSARAFASSRRALASTDSAAFVILQYYIRGRPPNRRLEQTLGGPAGA